MDWRACSGEFEERPKVSGESFDIAVIGGGVIGLSLARRLGAEKARVAVIDAGAQISPATNAAAGMLAPSFESAEGSAALYDFGVRSLALWPAFAAELEAASGQSIDYRQDGILGAAFTQEELSKLQADARWLREQGAAAELISGEEARRLEPALSGDIIGALHATKDGQVDPRKALAALRIAFQRQGGVIFDRRVIEFRKAGHGYALRSDNGEALSAEKIVIASGAAATSLAKELPAQPILPVKGEAVALAMEENLLRKVVRAPGAYLCPKAGGRLVIGATEYEGRDDLDVSGEAIATLKHNGAKAAPAIAGCAEIERWAGLRPATPDGAPILGRDANGPENVFFALGHHRNGVLLAPATAQALSKEVLGNAPLRELNAFRAERFAAIESERRHG